MNENDLPGRIVARLDQSLDELPAPVIRKLQAARQAAVAQHRRRESGWGHSWSGNVLRGWLFGRGLAVRLILPVAIIIAGLTGLIYWQISSHHDDELEAGLLAGELPIHAYIDPGFESWLQHASHNSQQQ